MTKLLITIWCHILYVHHFKSSFTPYLKTNSLFLRTVFRKFCPYLGLYSRVGYNGMPIVEPGVLIHIYEWLSLNFNSKWIILLQESQLILNNAGKIFSNTLTSPEFLASYYSKPCVSVVHKQMYVGHWVAKQVVLCLQEQKC